MAITPMTPPIKRTDVDPSDAASVAAFVSSAENFYDLLATDFVDEVNDTETNMDALEAATQLAKAAAETAKTGAETAQGLAEDARDLAQGYAQDAADTVALLPMGSISDTAPSLTQAYSSSKVEERLTEVGASLMQTGDILYTVSPRTAPEYLPCSGQLYDHTIYSDLYSLLGDLPAFGTRYGTTTALTTGRVSEFSADATYFVAASSGSPYWEVHKRSGDTFTKLSSMPTAGNSVSHAKFDPSDTYLAVAVIGADGLSKIFKRSGDSFSAAGITFTPPTGTSFVASWGGTDTVAFSNSVSPYFNVYSRTGDVFTKLADPATLPTKYGIVALNSDGTMLAVLQAITNSVFIYSILEGVIEYITTLKSNSTANPQYGVTIAFSPDDAYLYVAGYSPTLFKVSDWSKIAIEFNIGSNTANFLNPIAWVDATTFILAVPSNMIATFKIINGVVIMLQRLTTYSNINDMYAVACAGGYLAVTGNLTPYHDIYKLGKALPIIPGSYIKTGVTA